MADVIFTTPAGNVVQRKELILYMNTGTSSEPVWSPIGMRVEDSSMGYDFAEESSTDIFGNVYTVYKPPVITQTFEPCTLESSDAALVKIWNQSIKDQNTGAMTNNDLLILHAYAESEDGTGAFGERYPNSAIKPTGLGGSANIGMPIDVTFGGNRETGAVTKADGVVIFTKK